MFSEGEKLDTEACLSVYLSTFTVTDIPHKCIMNITNMNKCSNSKTFTFHSYWHIQLQIIFIHLLYTPTELCELNLYMQQTIFFILIHSFQYNKLQWISRISELFYSIYWLLYIWLKSRANEERLYLKELCSPHQTDFEVIRRNISNGFQMGRRVFQRCAAK